MTSVEEKLGREIARWVQFVAGRPRSTLAWAAAFTVLAVIVAFFRLGVVSDTDELFDPELPFRALRIQVEEALPLRADTILVVVDGPNVIAAGDAALDLADRVRADGDPFAAVFAPGLGDFFERNGFLYLETSELEDIADDLDGAQPFLAELRRDPSVRGVFGQLERAVLHLGDDVAGGLDLGAVFEGILSALHDAERLDPHPNAFGDLVLGGSREDGRARRFVIVKPVLDHGDFVPGGDAVERLREIFDEVDYERRGIEMAITGDLALKAEEFSIVEGQARLAGLASFVMVFGILWLALGSWRLIFSAITALLMGLFWTTGFAAITIGHMNLISVTFIVLFIGLGIDFAIHFTMRYQELRLTGADHMGALDETARGVGGSLALCAVTTAIGFYAFVPTQYLGVAELGLISGTGMLFSLFASLTVLPAAMSLGNAGAPLRLPASGGLSLPTWPIRWPRAVVTAAVLVAVGSSFLLPRLEFDANPLRVRDPNSESVRAFEELVSDDAVNPWSIDVLASDLAEAERIAKRAQALPSVAEARTLSSFVPTDQDDKLYVIEDLAFLLEPPSGGELAAPTLAENLTALRRFRVALGENGTVGGDLPPTAGRLGEELDRFLAGVDSDGATVDALRVALVDAILDRLVRLDLALSAEPISLVDLPGSLRDRMLTADGAALVEIYPEDDLNDAAALARFVEEVRGIAEDATGSSVYMLEASNTIMDSLQQALATALVLITLVVLALWRKLRDTALVLAPLLLAGAVTGAFSVLGGLSVNFADVIVVPLLLGIGVDSGIHLVHRHRDDEERATDGLLATSTPRAILWSALTTIASFGSLGFATHLGMASLGQLLCLGVVMTLAANLIFLPALLALTDRRQA